MAIPLIFTLLAYGCSAGSSDDGCVEGETQPCLCGGGSEGAQVCEADSTWGACDCGGSDADGDVDADTDGDADGDGSEKCSGTCDCYCKALIDCGGYEGTLDECLNGDKPCVEEEQSQDAEVSCIADCYLDKATCDEWKSCMGECKD